MKMNVAESLSKAFDAFWAGVTAGRKSDEPWIVLAPSRGRAGCFIGDVR